MDLYDRYYHKAKELVEDNVSHFQNGCDYETAIQLMMLALQNGANIVLGDELEKLKALNKKVDNLPKTS